jgi:hypothetical protein
MMTFGMLGSAKNSLKYLKPANCPAKIPSTILKSEKAMYSPEKGRYEKIKSHTIPSNTMICKAPCSFKLCSGEVEIFFLRFIPS